MTDRSKTRKSTDENRDFINALRECLGYGPLYGPDGLPPSRINVAARHTPGRGGSVERDAMRRFYVNYSGDGNRLVPRSGTL